MSLRRNNVATDDVGHNNLKFPRLFFNFPDHSLCSALHTRIHHTSHRFQISDITTNQKMAKFGDKNCAAVDQSTPRFEFPISLWTRNIDYANMVVTMLIKYSNGIQRGFPRFCTRFSRFSRFFIVVSAIWYRSMVKLTFWIAICCVSARRRSLAIYINIS